MDTTTAAAEALFRIILWVPEHDRDLMIADLREQLGDEAADEVAHMVKVHEVNGNG